MCPQAFFPAPACITPHKVHACSASSRPRVGQGWWVAPFPPKDQHHPLPLGCCWDRWAPAAQGISLPSTERITEGSPRHKTPSNAGILMHGRKREGRMAFCKKLIFIEATMSHRSCQLAWGITIAVAWTIAAGAHKGDCFSPESNILYSTYIHKNESFPTARKQVCWQVYITTKSLLDWGMLVTAKR